MYHPVKYLEMQDLSVLHEFYMIKLLVAGIVINLVLRMLAAHAILFTYRRKYFEFYLF